jgi:hypothetical protein
LVLVAGGYLPRGIVKHLSVDHTPVCRVGLSLGLLCSKPIPGNETAASEFFAEIRAFVGFNETLLVTAAN